MRNRTQYLTVLQFDLCGVQGDKLDHYRKGAVPEQQMFPISYVKGCKNIHQYTPGTGELVLVVIVSTYSLNSLLVCEPHVTVEKKPTLKTLQTESLDFIRN